MWRAHRDLLEQDLHATYGLDLNLAAPDTDPVLTARDWRWFLVRLDGLRNDPDTRLWGVLAALNPPPKPAA